MWVSFEPVVLQAKAALPRISAAQFAGLGDACGQSPRCLSCFGALGTFLTDLLCLGVAWA
jgi:hypothetical protein